MTEQRIAQILSTMFGVEETEVSRSASFTGDMLLNSFDFLQFLYAVQTECGRTIPMEDAVKLKTVGALCDYLE